MSDDERDAAEDAPQEIVLPIEDSIDLHAFRPRDVRSVVESYLEEVRSLGLTEVRVIHGRGVGVQRDIVRSLLSRHPDVLEFFDAPPARGGWGATVVRLRPPPGGDGFDDEPGSDRQ